jgi:hypothetical protein
MKFSIDISSRVSAELSAAIEKMASDPYREHAPTLGNVRMMLLNRAAGTRVRTDSLQAQRTADLVEEIGALIDEFGADALADDFAAAKASEGLSRIIEFAMSSTAVGHHPPTLGSLRDAMAEGLTAQLVGDGTLDPDEDQTLLAEIDGLILRHGADAVAEEYVRFE